MSRVVAVAGSSHSPMLADEPEIVWAWRAAGDESARYADRDGVVRPTTEIASRLGDTLAAELSPTVWRAKWAECQASIARLRRDLLALQPDLLLIVGDDQGEVFDLGNNPAIAVFYGDALTVARPRPPATLDADAQARLVKVLHDLGNDGSTFPVDGAAASAIIGSLVGAGFDLATSNELPTGRAFGHAFSWVLGRLLEHTTIPCVPILLNTYFPPNQPTAARCFDFGVALRAAAESLVGERRVAVIASGGLSHFVVNEALDDVVVQAMREVDADTLRALPEPLLQEGSSEIKNWITAIGAAGDLRCAWLDYVRGYRSLAGTGVGLAFGLWREPDNEETH